jgi:hypothetical protein
VQHYQRCASKQPVSEGLAASAAAELGLLLVLTACSLLGGCRVSLTGSGCVCVCVAMSAAHGVLTCCVAVQVSHMLCSLAGYSHAV